MQIMGVVGKARSVAGMSGRVANEAVSFVTFCVLDLVDFFLCFVFKAVDLWVEADFRPCYCSNSAKEAITRSGNKILVCEQGGESKIVSLISSTKLELEEISDTLYSRPSLVSEVWRSLTLNELKRFKLLGKEIKPFVQSKRPNFTVVEMVQGIIGRHQIHHPIPRWSDCDCKLCTCWVSSHNNTNTNSNSNSNSKGTLYVKSQCRPTTEEEGEDVVFIHGFISSSLFWSETVFPRIRSRGKSGKRLFAVDLLGFGRSPKPSESMYTLREHVEMIERSVLEAHKVKSFHIVAHSLGCILALALAVNHPQSVKSLTLLAPPFYPVPKGETQATQYVMRKVAPRRVWPPMAFGASLACWYEHISRLICLLICKNHRLWEFLTKLLTRNRVRTFLLEGFFCHTHNAAWHTLHNIICGTAGKVGSYLDAVRENQKCKVTIFHGKKDEVIPVECSYEVQKRIPRAQLRVIDDKDHITIVVGRQKAFARELEEIWNSTANHN